MTNTGFWWLRDSWDGRERRGSQPGHFFFDGGPQFMQPG
jgi:hypothetical protein